MFSAASAWVSAPASRIGEPQPIWRLTLAGLAYVPAMAVIAGVAAMAVAVRNAWIGWLAVTFVADVSCILERCCCCSCADRPVAGGPYGSSDGLRRRCADGHGCHRRGTDTFRRLDLSQPRRGLERKGKRRRNH